MFARRKLLRLKDYDYAKEGMYFVTVCVDQCAHDHFSKCIKNTNKNIFGHIKNNEIILNDIGKIIYDSWLWLSHQYNYVELDEFIIMPNHMHGIIFLNHMDTRITGTLHCTGASRGAPTIYKPLGQLIGAFKTISTKQINQLRNTPHKRLWQRNFYEHVIRNESDLNRIREYIINNPIDWKNDEYF